MSATATCSHPACPNPHHAKNLCLKHYFRLRRHGDSAIVYIVPPAIERFWARVDKSGECWLWTGYRDKAGYGRFYPNGGKEPFVLCHRFSWRLANPDAPEPKMVLHLCDTPPCQKPEHLRAGTAQDNMDDKMARGRWSNGRNNVGAVDNGIR